MQRKHLFEPLRIAECPKAFIRAFTQRLLHQLWRQRPEHLGWPQGRDHPSLRIEDTPAPGSRSAPLEDARKAGSCAMPGEHICSRDGCRPRRSVSFRSEILAQKMLVGQHLKIGRRHRNHVTPATSTRIRRSRNECMMVLSLDLDAGRSSESGSIFPYRTVLQSSSSKERIPHLD